MALSCSVGSVAMALALLTQMSMPPNRSHGGIDGALDVLFLADVADHRGGLTAGGLDLLGGGVDGALELGVGLGGLGEQHDVGAPACGAERDRQADTPAGAGDDEGAVAQGCIPVSAMCLPGVICM